HPVAAADLVHAGELGRGAVHAAGGQQLVPALGNGLGARRRGAVDAARRRAYRGSDQTGLSRAARASRARAADPLAAAGAGALAKHAGVISYPPLEGSETSEARSWVDANEMSGGVG